MFQENHQLSTVTAVLPNATSELVLEELLGQAGTSAFVWQGRGTLLHDNWWQRWVPPISPAKTVLEMVVPDHQVERVVDVVMERGRLDLQATGAVFSTPCERVHQGGAFEAWPHEQALARNSAHALSDTLAVIYCIVAHNLSDRMARAAVNAGAHGPVVYYCEGRGLRDRLGWLRVTKEHEKEVLMVIADGSDAEDVFDTMAKVGELHLPGRGFMYRIDIDRGMFNLPSRVSHHHYAANMQQIINAIDHLSGHSHWRDQASSKALARSSRARSATPHTHEQQLCMSAIVRRDQMTPFVDLLLDASAPGLNFNYARRVSGHNGVLLAGARVSEEYAMVRCIASADLVEHMCEAIETSAEGLGVCDVMVRVQTIARIATYRPGSVDYRRAEVA